jgi:arylsulfatase A-like enzyme
LSAPHTPWLPTEAFRGKSRAGFYGDFVAQVDHTVGQVLDALDDVKLAENTLVIVTSDNGSHWPEDDEKKYGHFANLHYRGQKADIWEGGHRVPFIARWPGRIKPGTTSSALISLTDLTATCASIAGIPLGDQEGVDSFDILSALLGEASGDSVRDTAVMHSFRGLFAIRKGHWKLIEGRGSGGFTQPTVYKPKEGEPAGQLYNLAEDPSETNNLYLEKPDKVKALKELLEEIKSKGRSR